MTTVPATFTGDGGEISRVPPQDLDAEQAVLGSIMLSRDAFDDVAEIVTGRDFYRPAHETIYRTALDLNAQGDRVDPITLAAELTRRGDLARVGGASYLHTLVNAVPTAANAEYYAGIIREKAVLRRIVEAGTRIAQLGYGERGDLDEIRGTVEAEIHAALMDGGDELPYAFIGEGVEGVIDELQARQDGVMDTQGILTGLYDLDSLCGGFKGGQLIVIGARPAMGKSTLALDFARTAAFRQNVPVAFFSLEMGQRELIKRTLSAEGRVALHHIEHANLTEDDWHKIAVVHSAIKGEHPDPDGAPLIIDDSPNLTLATIQSRARRMQRQHHIGMVIVDYLQLLTAGTGKRHQPRHEEVAELSRNLKLMAKELDVPVIALSQLNRGPEQTADKVPMLSHLRESGAVEQDADMVILLHREDAYDKGSPRAGEADLIIAKHRGGPTTTITAAAQLHYSRFANMAPEPDGYHMPRRETPVKAAAAALPAPRTINTPNSAPAGPQTAVQAPPRTPEDDHPDPAEPTRVQGSGTERVNGRSVTNVQLPAAEAGEHQEHDDVRETDDVPAPRSAPAGTAGAEAERPEAVYEERDDERGFPALSHLKQGIKRSRLHPVPVIRKVERDGEPWSLMIQQMDCSPKWLAPGWGSRMIRYEEDGKRRRRRELIVPKDAGAGTLVVIDRNGSFPASCSSVTVAANVLHHTGALTTRDIADSNGKPCKLGGIFYAEVPAWERTDMPHPWGRITDYADANGAVWVPTPVIELTERLAKDGHLAAPVIRDSWAGRSTQGLFKPLYEEARKAREEFIKAGNLKDPAYAEYKLRASTAVRLLWPKEVNSPFWRPDWYLSVVAESSVRHWVQAFRAVQAGHHLVALQKTDEAAFWTPDGVVPDTYRVGSMFGEIKTKGGLS